jgi:hypothetical protein
VSTFAIQPPVQDSAVATNRSPASSSSPKRLASRCRVSSDGFDALKVYPLSVAFGDAAAGDAGRHGLDPTHAVAETIVKRVKHGPLILAQSSMDR